MDSPHGAPRQVPRWPVSFENRGGATLFGVMHGGFGATHRTALILLSPGAKMRVGPGRLYWQLANNMAALGLPVLRFDFEGLGDSHGDLREDLLADVYGKVEVGKYVTDVEDAMNWMATTYGTTDFILAGLCGGAITGLLTANRNPQVRGLLSIAITPILSHPMSDPSRYMTNGQLTRLRGQYLGKVVSPKAWLRVLTLRTDFRALWRSLVRPLRGSRVQPVEPGSATPNDNTNPLFAGAFFGMLSSGRPVLVVFGGADRLLWEFQEKIRDRHQASFAALATQPEIHTIPHANHVLTFPEWRDELVGITTDWLRRHFPDALREV